MLKLKLSDKYPNQFFTTQTGYVFKHDEVVEVKNEGDPDIVNGLASGFLSIVDEKKESFKKKALKEVVSEKKVKENKKAVDKIKGKKSDSKDDKNLFSE